MMSRTAPSSACAARTGSEFGERLKADTRPESVPAKEAKSAGSGFERSAASKVARNCTQR
jgi:hypothetical protein